MGDIYDKVRKSDNILKPSEIFEQVVMQKLQAIEQSISEIRQEINNTQEMLSQPLLSISEVTTLCTQTESAIAKLKQNNADQEEIKKGEKLLAVFIKYRDKTMEDMIPHLLSAAGLECKSDAPQ